MKDYSNDKFMESLKKYGFLDGEYTIYIDSWPELKIQLTNNQIKEIKNINIGSRIIQCENMIAHTNNIPNLCGSTKFSTNNNWLILKGSQIVIQAFLESVF